MLSVCSVRQKVLWGKCEGITKKKTVEIEYLWIFEIYASFSSAEVHTFYYIRFHIPNRSVCCVPFLRLPDRTTTFDLLNESSVQVIDLAQTP